jgi:hypothetical protein
MKMNLSRNCEQLLAAAVRVLLAADVVLRWQ